MPDLQRFWVDMRDKGPIGNAINSDAGDVGQLAYQMRGGNYTLIPSRNASPFERRILSPNFQTLPKSVSLCTSSCGNGRRERRLVSHLSLETSMLGVALEKQLYGKLTLDEMLMEVEWSLSAMA